MRTFSFGESRIAISCLFALASSSMGDELEIPVHATPKMVINAHPQFSHWRDAQYIEPSVSDLQFLPTSGILASSGLDRAVRMWNPTTGSSIPFYYVELKHEVRCFAVTNDGRFLARAGNHDYDEPRTITNIGPLSRTEGCVYIYDRERLDQSAEAILVTEKGAVVSVAFSPNDELLLVGTDAGTCEVWSTAGLPDWKKLNRKRVLVHCQEDKEVQTRFSPTGKCFATVGGLQVKLWEPDAEEPMTVLKGHQDVAFSRDGALLAFYPLSRMTPTVAVTIWNVDKRKRETTLQSNLKRLKEIYKYADIDGGLVFLPGRDILIQGHSRLITIWDVSRGKPLAILDGKSSRPARSHGPVVHLSVSPNGKLLATAEEASPEIRIWDLETLLE